MAVAEQLDKTFSALADPTRRTILTKLAKGEKTVTELAAPFDMSMPAITKHLKVLEKAGLIERGKTAQWRPCKLRVKPLKEASAWIENYRKFWDEKFDRLDDYLYELQTEDKKNAKRKKRKRH